MQQRDLRPPLLQINGVRVIGPGFSPIKRSRPVESSSRDENGDWDVLGISPFKKCQVVENPHAASRPIRSMAPLAKRPSSSSSSFSTRRTVIADLVHRFPDLRLSIDALPIELLYHFFSFLQPVDLLRVSMVCRLWNRVADDKSLWFDHFTFSENLPTDRACRWPALWVRFRRDELRKEREQMVDELFSIDERLDHEEELQRLRETFRSIDEYTLMEQ